MQSVAFAAPLLPGKTETVLNDIRSTQGERKQGHESSRERHGISREAVWLLPTPAGDMVVVYLEADDPQAAFAGIASSQEPLTSGSASRSGSATVSTSRRVCRCRSRSWAPVVVRRAAHPGAGARRIRQPDLRRPGHRPRPQPAAPGRAAVRRGLRPVRRGHRPLGTPSSHMPQVARSTHRISVPLGAD